jgi:hypothetical protein
MLNWIVKLCKVQCEFVNWIQLADILVQWMCLSEFPHYGSFLNQSSDYELLNKCSVRKYLVMNWICIIQTCSNGRMKCSSKYFKKMLNVRIYGFNGRRSCVWFPAGTRNSSLLHSAQIGSRAHWTHSLEFLVTLYSGAFANSQLQSSFASLGLQFTTHSLSPLGVLFFTCPLAPAYNGRCSLSWVPELSPSDSRSNSWLTVHSLPPSSETAFNCRPLTLTNFFVKVKVILRLTVSRPVRLGVKHPSGTRDQFFFLLEIFFRQLRVCYFVAPSLTRGRVCNLLFLLDLASGSESPRRESRPYFIFQILETPPTCRARSPYLYPPETGRPRYTSGH